MAVFQGIQMSGGYEIAIQEIVETENTLDTVGKVAPDLKVAGML